MDTTFALVVTIVVIALVFDFINGFHDAANSIATIVATRVLSPFQAVAWAAFFNFAAAFAGGTAVAKTVGTGLIDLKLVTPYVILAALLGAIIWDLITWWFALPTSSSHALIGAYAGAAMARAAIVIGPANAFDPILWDGWRMTLFAIVAAPLAGMLIAYLLMIAITWMFRRSSPRQMDGWFRRLQLVSAALFSFSHGKNDALKTAGIIMGVLITTGYATSAEPPWRVILAVHAAIALGTLSGGWRIVRTMGARLTKLKPRSGFCAETGAGVAILMVSELGIPVSTTHVIAGSIAGVGSVQRLKAVRWGLATNIVWAWVMTIPASAAVAALAFGLIKFFVNAA